MDPKSSALIEDICVTNSSNYPGINVVSIIPSRYLDLSVAIIIPLIIHFHRITDYPMHYLLHLSFEDSFHAVH